MLPVIHGEFTLGSDPHLRFTPSGAAVCDVRAVASSRKNFGTQDNPDWRDDRTAWVNLVGWRKMAENMAESLEKGKKVTVVGKLEIEEWEDQDGKKRITPKIHVDSMGPAITFDPARHFQAGGQQQQQGGQQQRPSGNRPPSNEDPWATPNQNDEPPF